MPSVGVRYSKGDAWVALAGGTDIQPVTYFGRAVSNKQAFEGFAIAQFEPTFLNSMHQLRPEDPELCCQ